MNLGRRSFVIAIVLMVFVSALAPSTASAQIEPHRLSVSTRPASPANTCQNAPGPCGGAGSDESIGPHEFDIYLAPEYGVYEKARFTLEWEPSWRLQSYEVCYGTFLSGDPATPGSSLVFSAPDCDSRPVPFLRMSMDCPTSGTFRIRNGQVQCGTMYWESELYDPHCEIGNFCGMDPVSPCGFCFDENAGSFNPPSLDIFRPQGQSEILTLHVWGSIGDACSSLPECGGDFHGACFGGLRTDRSWLSASVDWLGYHDGFHEFPYDLTVRPGSLPPGDYDGRVYTISGGCVTCRENCMQVHMTVLDPADAPETRDGASPLLSVLAPNPSHGELSYTVQLRRPGRVSVEVVDVTGRVVARPAAFDLAEGVHRLKWSATESAPRLTSGIYFLQVIAPEGRQSRLFVLSN